MNVVNAGMNVRMFKMDGDPPISQLANELMSQSLSKLALK
jgi:hypothetical protein